MLPLNHPSTVKNSRQLPEGQRALPAPPQIRVNNQSIVHPPQLEKDTASFTRSRPQSGGFSAKELSQEEGWLRLSWPNLYARKNPRYQPLEKTTYKNSPFQIMVKPEAGGTVVENLSKPFIRQLESGQHGPGLQRKLERLTALNRL